MTWKAYRVVFKLKSPMHIGCGKVGNVQRTRPYVTGRVFWGALTMRLTRDAHEGKGPATASRQYECYGKKVCEQLAFTYFYTTDKEDYRVDFPWENESQFRRRFSSSYTSTALVYPQQAADEGLLHEVEFISPRTLDEAKQVYLVGYVFEIEGCTLSWKEACQRLQLGGERGYGWGDVQCVEAEAIAKTDPLFNQNYHWEERDGFVTIQTSENSSLLAHMATENGSATGEIEPLVGREWKVANQAGESVEFSGFCWIPGSKVAQKSDFAIEKFGIWHLSP